MKTIAVKIWKYLFWLGPVLIVMGGSAAVVSGDWGSIPLGLLIAGIVLTGLWLLLQAYESKWWGRRSTQAGTNALIATLSVLVILGLLNFLGTRYPVRVDLTETQMFTLAPESRQLVRHLQQPIKVLVFDRNPNPQDRELLLNYLRQGPKFSFEYVDPQTQPALAKKFGVKDFGAVYLEANQQQKFVQVVNEQERLSETKLTNAIEQIQSGRTDKVYFLDDHGEHSLSAGQGGLSEALNSLKNKNFTTEPLNLAQQPVVPKDATVIVVAGPKRALFDQEVKALSDYLNQGGGLLLMIDPNTNPNLDSLLKGWGVKVDNSLAVDISGAGIGFGPAVPLVTQYGNNPITKDFGNGISFYPLARPIEIASVPGVQANPLLFTNPYPQSWAHSNLHSQDLKFDPKTDRPGPLILGVALSRSSTPTPTNSPAKQSQPKSSPSPQASATTIPTNSPAKTEPDKKPAESRLVVIGNSDFATDGRFDQQLNGDVFLNSVSWLGQQDNQLLSIRPKQEKNRRINMTQMQATLLGWTSLLLFPFIGFGTAVLLWWKRR